MADRAEHRCAACGLRLHRYSPNHPGTPTDLMGCVNSLAARVSALEAALRDLSRASPAIRHVNGMHECRHCHAKRASLPTLHEHDCPWLAARRLVEEGEADE